MKFRSRLQEPMVRLMGALCLLACTCGGEAETVRAPTGAITLESESCTLIVPPATARPTETGSTELPVRLCPQMQVLYLNFDGQTVVGAATDDLANSRSTIVGS